MPRFELALDIDRRGSSPLFVQIARGLSAAIRDGRLRPGAKLPGSRSLATTLNVHRNTVVQAYDELLAAGWVASAPRSGVFVSRELPERAPRRFAGQALVRERVPPRPGFAFEASPAPREAREAPRGTLVMWGGVPDVRLAPARELARAYRRALGDPTRTLGYVDPRGEPRLRAAIAAMLASTRGLACGPDDVLVTRGSQMALDLLARALVRPGDLVAVEDPGYGAAWRAFAAAGAELAPVRVDRDGMVVGDLARLASVEAGRRLRAVYLTPHHQYPTMATLAAPRRLELLALAERARFAVIEDDYDHEFRYQGRPVLPLASADRAGSVAYVGTLSKVLAPGLRLGYVVAPRALQDELAARRMDLDRQGDPAIERAVAELFENGELARHVGRMRRTYQARRDALVAALRARLSGVLAFDVPPGGQALWAGVDPAIDVAAWAAAASKHGVVFQPGGDFTLDGRAIPFARLGFAALDERELGQAVERLAAALPAAGSRGRRPPARTAGRPLRPAPAPSKRPPP